MSTAAVRPLVHVAAGALVADDGRVLVARRAAKAHQGGLWEFPGGKLEAGEAVIDALARELNEELGVELERARPLLKVRHDYADKSVLLDVWRVDRWRGEPHGREGQPVAWRFPDQLNQADFPAADVPILTALRLPECYLVTDEPSDGFTAFLDRLQAALARGVRLVQLRAHSLDETALAALYRQAHALTAASGVPLLVNSSPELAQRIGADGVHLSGAQLRRCQQRPLPGGCWVAASCHDADELALARRLGVDFAVLGPVAATMSHPGQVGIGWSEFASRCAATSLPIYALGGVGPGDLEMAWAHGAIGIAAIRALW